MEVNVYRKKIRKNTVRVAFVFPSTYEAMASSLISHIAYSLINQFYPEVFVERFTAEEPFRSIETGTPLKYFDLILTSLSYEPNIAQLVRILEKSGVPADRIRREIPVVAGGPVAIANPAPYRDIIDAFIVGEAENTLANIMDVFLEYRSKRGFLEELSQHRDIYVPGFNDDRVIMRTYVGDLNNAFYPSRQFYSPQRVSAYGPGFIMESSRGCRFWCRFCMEGRLFKPYRCRSFSVMLDLIERGLSYSGFKRVIFYSLNFLLNNEERRLLEKLVEEGVSFNIPSLRLEAVNSDVLGLVKIGGQKTITVAPESFSPHVQEILGKYSDVSWVYGVVSSIIKLGFNVKIYLISGIKGETIDDVKENINAIRRLGREARGKGVRINVSINPLIPKPRTPFQWIGMVRAERARRLISYYRRQLGGLVESRPLNVNWGWVQASLALGDSRLSRIIVEWGRSGGDLASWRRITRSTGFDTGYVFEGRSFEEPLPWENILVGEWVEEEARRSYRVLLRDVRGY